MDCSPPGFSVHAISQAKILEWVAIFFSRDLPDPGIESASPALAGGFFTTEPPGKVVQLHYYISLIQILITAWHCWKKSRDWKKEKYPYRQMPQERAKMKVKWRQIWNWKRDFPKGEDTGVHRCHWGSRFRRDWKKRNIYTRKGLGDQNINQSLGGFSFSYIFLLVLPPVW